MAVPTQGTKYTLRCNCWLAKDRGDGVTSRVFDLLDAMVVNIGVKVWRACVNAWPGRGQCMLGWESSKGDRSERRSKLTLGHWQGLQPTIPVRPTLLGAKRLKSSLVFCCVTLGKSSGLSEPWLSHTAHGNNTSHPVPCRI